jgi:NTP pyrophosphatase (non-canonical NTP hydrolase)
MENSKPVTLNDYAKTCHEANKKWWHDPATGVPVQRNKGELIALIHSELSEALEAERKDLWDDKIVTRKGAEVELVDALIRIFDYAGAFGYDLQGAFDDKMAFNKTRADHTHEVRRVEGGKKF